LSDEVKDALRRIASSATHSMASGTCADCGKPYPGEWPPPDNVLENGWNIWGDVTDDSIQFLSCGECDSAREE
jgi:hypothetical protein